MMRIIAEKGLPGEGWQTKMPVRLAHYIEAQVWNRAVLLDYLALGWKRRSGRLTKTL